MMNVVVLGAILLTPFSFPVKEIMQDMDKGEKEEFFTDLWSSREEMFDHIQSREDMTEQEAKECYFNLMHDALIEVYKDEA